VRTLWHRVQGAGLCTVYIRVCTICMYMYINCTKAATENSLLREAYANARWANQLIFIMGDILLDHPTGNRITGASGFDTSACVWLGTHGCGGGEYSIYIRTPLKTDFYYIIYYYFLLCWFFFYSVFYLIFFYVFNNNFYQIL